MKATRDTRQDDTAVADFHPTTPASGPRAPRRFLLWVDGVGGYLVCLGDRVALGGPGDADVPLMASLSRRHATLVRSGESYLLEAHGPTHIAGRPVDEPSPLRDGDAVEMGDALTLRFRQPSALSATAVLEPTDRSLLLAPASRGRKLAASTLDGVVLLDGVCLIGPGSDKHIVCPDTDETLVLFRRDGEFYCKAPAGVWIDGEPAPAWGPVRPGDIVTTADMQFHFEEHLD